MPRTLNREWSKVSAESLIEWEDSRYIDIFGPGFKCRGCTSAEP